MKFTRFVVNFIRFVETVAAANELPEPPTQMRTFFPAVCVLLTTYEE